MERPEGMARSRRLPLPVTDVRRRHQYGFAALAEPTRRHHPRQALTDPDALNAAIPMTEWELDLDGKPRPPWELIYAIYMIDLATGATYTYRQLDGRRPLCLEQLRSQSLSCARCAGAKSSRWCAWSSGR